MSAANNQQANIAAPWSIEHSAVSLPTPKYVIKDASGQAQFYLVSEFEAKGVVAMASEILSLRAEVAEYRKDINGILEECAKHITLSNDFPWAEEVHCAFHSLAKNGPPVVEAPPVSTSAEKCAREIYHMQMPSMSCYAHIEDCTEAGIAKIASVLARHFNGQGEDSK